MIRFVHISDLHIHARLPNTGAERLLEFIHNEYADDAARSHTYIILTGDLVDDGQDNQYDQACALLERFRGRLLVAPGNHDYGVLGNFFDQKAVARFDARLGPLTPSGYLAFGQKTLAKDELCDGQGTQVLAIGVNSCLMTPSPLDFACGEIGHAALEALQSTLADERYCNHRIVVYLHHKPLPLGVEAPVMQLRDARAFLSLVEGRADVVAFGHSGDNSEAVHHKGAMQSRMKAKTFMLDANSSVEQKTYFEITCERDRMQVTWRSVRD
jgi:3',5'-cyclic AMP phosphodiesterase CpdA